jgi:hypothetical protein
MFPKCKIASLFGKMFLLRSSAGMLFTSVASGCLVISEMYAATAATFHEVVLTNLLPTSQF